MASVFISLNGIYVVYMYTDTKVYMCVRGVLVFVEMVLLIAEWMSPVDTSQSVRWLFPSGAILSGFILHEREDHLWLGALPCDLGQVVLTFSGHQIL